MAKETGQYPKGFIGKTYGASKQDFEKDLVQAKEIMATSKDRAGNVFKAAANFVNRAGQDIIGYAEAGAGGIGAIIDALKGVKMSPRAKKELAQAWQVFRDSTVAGAKAGAKKIEGAIVGPPLSIQAKRALEERRRSQ